jgi:hypothetical protein
VVWAHLVPVEMVGVDLRVPERDQLRAEAGPLEEDGGRRLGPVEEPISEELLARVSELDLSIALRLSVQEAPISKLGMGSEMPGEVSEPDQLDPRILRIRGSGSDP